MTAPVIDTLGLIGVGLIGSSICHGVRRHGIAKRIIASARSAETRAVVAELKLADQVMETAAEVAAAADLVILCTPIGAYEAIGREIAPALRPGTVVSDVGSVKQAVIRDLGPVIPKGVALVPGHPIAGTEQSGPRSGFAELFEGRWCILTPPTGTDPQAVASVSALWRGLGSRVTEMDAAHHDRVLAITSHLPHLIAYTIVGTATDLETHLREEVIKYSASGFRDFTRIAASDPVMWRDVFLNNREAVLDVLQRFSEDLTALQRAIRWGEGEVLEQAFAATREIRRGVIEAGQEKMPAPPEG